MKFTLSEVEGLKMTGQDSSVKPENDKFHMNYTDHRKARYEYHLLETYEGGLALTGQEAKSVREGGAKLDGSYLKLMGGNLVLIGARIAPYSKAGPLDGYDPIATRRVLVRRKELGQLATKTEAKGLTLVPISLYPKGRRIKLGFALAKGKQLHDKRETIKQRDVARQIRREFDE